MLKFTDDAEIKDFASFIRTEITPPYTYPLVDGGPRRKLLVVVNPIGGKGKGKDIYHQLLLPMLVDAGTPHEVIVTDSPGHAERISKEFDSEKFGAIAVIGGDGLFGEILNGLNSRSDRSTVLKIPIGVIPAGSSNCLACSVGLRQPLSAAFAIARGITRPLDALKVSLADNRVFLSVCGVSYGFISEVNTHAGKWRWLFGPARYSVCGFRTLVASPMTYHVDCRYRVPDQDDPEFDTTICGPDCGPCSRMKPKVSDPNSPTAVDQTFLGSVTGSTCSSENNEGEWVESSVIMEKKRRSVRPHVKQLDHSTMLLFSITNLSIRQSQNKTVWNQNCHMASGYMDLVLIPVISKWQLIKFFSKFSKGGNAHQENPDVFSVIKAKSVEMKISHPTDDLPDWEKEIQIAIDGEVYPLQPLRVDTVHGLLNLMCV